MNLSEIEQQRQRLEAQVASLRDSLKHWQLWDAEYEGLKEELQTREEDEVNDVCLSELSETYHGTLVTEKEIRDLSGLSSNQQRSREQIVNLIDRRLEYVARNLETLSRQYYAAEGKLEEFDFASAIATGSDPRFDDENTQSDSQLIEIHEQLDDNDNVVTSELRRPDDETQKILDIITATQRSGKASKVVPQNQRANAESNEDAHYTTIEEQEHSEDSQGVRRPPIRKKSVSFSADTKAAQQRESSEPPDGRKSVSFAAKVAVAPAAPSADTRSVSFAPAVVEIPPNAVDKQMPVKQDEDSNSALQSQLRSSFKPGETVYELNDDEEPAVRHIVLPANESPEDAEMRRQMLNYHLNEVGNVVAAMDIDDDDGYGDDHSDYTGSEYLDDLDTPYTTGTSDEDDEDEFGRTKGSAISDQYRMEMSALSARLMSSEETPLPTAIRADVTPASGSHTQTLAIHGGPTSISSVSSSTVESKEKANSKKRVSFAENLDVATDDSPPSKLQKATVHSPHPTKTANVFDTQSSAGEAADTSSFDEEEKGESTGPVVAETLVERAGKHATAVAPSAQDADLLMTQRELATEYYRRRNDMLREQGAFKSEGSEAGNEEQLYEERDGKVKKVSRFKAARFRG